MEINYTHNEILKDLKNYYLKHNNKQETIDYGISKFKLSEAKAIEMINSIEEYISNRTQMNTKTSEQPEIHEYESSVFKYIIHNNLPIILILAIIIWGLYRICSNGFDNNILFSILFGLQCVLSFLIILLLLGFGYRKATIKVYLYVLNKERNYISYSDFRAWNPQDEEDKKQNIHGYISRNYEITEIEKIVKRFNHIVIYGNIIYEFNQQGRKPVFWANKSKDFKKKLNKIYLAKQFKKQELLMIDFKNII